MARVFPNHAGKPLTFELQRGVNGSWRTLAYVDVKLSANSTAGVFVRGGSLRHGAYRFFAYIDADGRKRLPGDSDFFYFKVTA